ncbi:hypothetical protein AACH10_05420 [Ideonella sp. DXS22W]|uniref:Uncharacterized protein n=1 Tax=Pseudaquabacterium inlustre TaxID=2984192 RepID=A0ABU9CFJ0_9BURK
MSEAFDLARVRHDNALRLFDEFVHANVRSADAATLRGLERRFAERLQIQPSYWSQIKARSRQIGERLARQFEQLNRKPAGWMDQRHDGDAAAHASAQAATPAHMHTPGAAGGAARGLPLPSPTTGAGGSAGAAPSPSQPHDDDERFIVGLVLTYYRRHPQRARARLLDLLGEVLTPSDPGTDDRAAAAARPASRAGAPGAPGAPSSGPVVGRPTGATPRPAAGGTASGPAPAADDDLSLWQRSQSGVSPLPRKR